MVITDISRTQQFTNNRHEGSSSDNTTSGWEKERSKVLSVLAKILDEVLEQ